MRAVESFMLFTVTTTLSLRRHLAWLIPGASRFRQRPGHQCRLASFAVGEDGRAVRGSALRLSLPEFPGAPPTGVILGVRQANEYLFA